MNADSSTKSTRPGQPQGADNDDSTLDQNSLQQPFGKLNLSEYSPNQQNHEATSMHEGNVPLIPQSLQVASLQAEQPTAKKAMTGKLSDHGNNQGSLTGQRKMQGDWPRSGGNVSGKHLNVDHQSKYTFEEKHVAHLLDQVFDEDDAVGGDGGAMQRMTHGGAGSNAHPGPDAMTPNLLQNPKIFIDRSSDGYNELNSPLPYEGAGTDPCPSDDTNQSGSPVRPGLHPVRRSLTNKDERQSDDKDDPGKFQVDSELYRIQAPGRTASCEDWRVPDLMNRGSA